MRHKAKTKQLKYARPEKMKHLEMVQAVIARLATNSFAMKGWALTITLAAIGISLPGLRWPITALGLVSAATFWYLDSYYLRQERMFRRLHADVARGHTTNFDMDPRRYGAEEKWSKAFWSVPLAVLYAGLILVVLAVTVWGIAAQLLDAVPAVLRSVAGQNR